MAVLSLERVPAPAKLNLFLHIVGRRSDGYHLLQSVFTFVDLCDYLDFQRRDDGVITRAGQSLAGLSEDDDLIIQAARLLQRATGTHFGATIACDKRIPAGAGLGGGSSNAATTLIALNRLWQTGLSRTQLMQLGVQLGADVPVFIFGQSAFAQGIGEQLQAITLPNLSYLLIKPDVFVSTPAIFQDQGLTRDSKPVIITDFTDSLISIDPQKNHSVLFFGENVLETVACKQAPEIKTLLQGLRKNDLHARMTGSGSCVFVGFKDKEQATRQNSYLSGIILHGQPTMQMPPDRWVVNGLNTHPLYTWLKEFGD